MLGLFSTVLLFSGIMGTTPAYAKLLYSIQGDPMVGSQIGSPELCNGTIGNGGNLYEDGMRFSGKCAGGGRPAQIIPTSLPSRHTRGFLEFSTDSKVYGAGRARTELAITDRNFEFNQKLYVGFRLMIPVGTSDTDAFFYLMQFWQCSPLPPLAGVRLQRGPGGSHTINFMTRSDSREASMAHFNLKPGAWHAFVIALTPNPQGKGEMAVWAEGSPNPIIYNGAIGFSKTGACAGVQVPPQNFRLKFGIYKGLEGGRTFKVRFDDIKVGNVFRDVKPW